MDLDTLRFGASQEVDYGRGCKVITSEAHPDGLVLVFDGEGNGITQHDFAAKLIGRTISGELIVGFSKLTNFQLP
ncbi:hypothetical protein Pla22_25920 [Rubripirellula amarantea]|uniref:Uncharacterized protein n=2 Tax=Rubripirellula amarantea TaxID=2527999 RepID=A0A5C5WWH7_9BACT|nr:hypothetical protein Pla22_25920 [Rubripirellula amarantea]